MAYVDLNHLSPVLSVFVTWLNSRFDKIEQSKETDECNCKKKKKINDDVLKYRLFERIK